MKDKEIALKEAQKFTLDHFKSLFEKYPKGGFLKNEDLIIFMNECVRVGFVFGIKYQEGEVE